MTQPYIMFMTKQQIHGLQSSIYKDLLATSRANYTPGSKKELPQFTTQEVNAIAQAKVNNMLLSNVTKAYISSDIPIINMARKHNLPTFIGPFIKLRGYDDTVMRYQEN
jgi:hypothetical protein